MCGIWKYTICLAMMILESDSLPALEKFHITYNSLPFQLDIAIHEK